jgi:OmpA-OmpF porin, OOP family
MFNRTVVTAGQLMLDIFLSRAPTLNTSTITIVGHTDSVGDKTVNQRLSETRASSVKKYLVLKGLQPNNIRTSGKGDSSPVASNDTAEGRALNRRVDITVTRQK